MDLQAAQMMRGKRSMLSKVTVLACFALACALLIGSLISPGRTLPKSQFGASPNTATFPTA